MRNNQRVFDADTHGGPCAEVLEPYLDPSIRQLVPDLDQHKSPIKVGFAGEIREAPYKHFYRFSQRGGWGKDGVRVLGQAAAQTDIERRWQKFMGTRFPTEEGQWDAATRIKDMDDEGTDVQLIVPLGANEHPDADVEMAFLKAEHRFLDEF